MIISFIQTKGGTGKTTLAKCLAYSKAFKKAFGSVCLVELDPQGTIKTWHNERKESNLPDNSVDFVELSGAGSEKITKAIGELVEKHDAMILDVPGESVGKFATKFAATLSDITLFPMRTSTNDEQSFIDNVLPVVAQVIKSDPDKKGHFYIVPTFAHPQTNPQNLKEYFTDVMPDEVGCLKNFLPFRSVFENFSREGMTLQDYGKTVKNNSRFNVQAKKAIGDIEKIAKEILKLNS